MTNRTWSPQQSSIFTWFAAAVGNLVVRARAGTGKTTTIIEAITHIPGQVSILLCAFNKRIQLELGQKLSDQRAEAKTLHALGFAALRRSWTNVKVDDAVEWDRIRQADSKLPDPIAGLVKKLVGLAKGAAPFGTAVELEALAIAYGVEPDEDWAADGWTTADLARVAERVLSLSKIRDDRGRVSFDDMLFLPVVLDMVRPAFDWVIVDEAQDMNASQLILARKACKKGGHIVVVGDDRQAIYGFRGADSESIDRLKAELSAEELGLTITYRCPKAVVAVARRIVPDYLAAETAPEGTVEDLAMGRLSETVKVGDAILSRVNAPLVTLCLGLIRRGVPARIEGRDIGKMLLALVRKLNARTVPDFLKKTKAWEDKQVARIQSRGKDVEKKIQDVEDQSETLTALANGCASVAEIMDRCERFFSDSLDSAGNVSRAPAVVCSSVHKAKGLEWERVFVLADTLYCGGRRLDEPEEANIAYVAYTRAKDTLVLVHDAK